MAKMHILLYNIIGVNAAGPGEGSTAAFYLNSVFPDTIWAGVHSHHVCALYLQEPVEDLDPERILDLQTDSRLHVISGGTKVVQHSPPLRASAGLKR